LKPDEQVIFIFKPINDEEYVVQSEIIIKYRGVEKNIGK
jgi:hypothetical protein